MSEPGEEETAEEEIGSLSRINCDGFLYAKVAAIIAEVLWVIAKGTYLSESKFSGDLPELDDRTPVPRAGSIVDSSQPLAIGGKEKMANAHGLIVLVGGDSTKFFPTGQVPQDNFVGLSRVRHDEERLPVDFSRGSREKIQRFCDLPGPGESAGKWYHGAA